MMSCKYCSREFSTMSNLYAHQKKAKYCIRKQEEIKQEELNEKRKCEACNATFSSVSNLNKHRKTCIDYIVNDTKKEMKEHYEKLIEEIKQQYDKRIQELLNINKNISSKKTTINNGNVTYNHIDFSRIPALTSEYIVQQAAYLERKHLNNANQMGHFIHKELMKNVFVTDRTRGKVVYVDENSIPVTDCTVEAILQKMLEPIQSQLAAKSEEEFKYVSSLKPNDATFEKENEIRVLRVTLQKIARGEVLEDKYDKVQNQLVSVICRYANGKRQLYALRNDVQSITAPIENITDLNGDNIPIPNSNISSNLNTLPPDPADKNAIPPEGYVRKYNSIEEKYMFMKLNSNNLWVAINDEYFKYSKTTIFDDSDYPESDSDVEAEPVVKKVEVKPVISEPVIKPVEKKEMSLIDLCIAYNVWPKDNERDYSDDENEEE
jgi:hypothetical protein